MVTIHGGGGSSSGDGDSSGGGDGGGVAIVVRCGVVSWRQQQWRWKPQQWNQFGGASLGEEVGGVKMREAVW